MNAPSRKKQHESGDTVPVAARVVTQRNCLAVVGLPPRRYLEFVRAHGTLRPRRVGKLVLVNADELQGALLATATPNEDVQTGPTDAPEAVTTEAVLARLGYRPA